MGARGDKLVAIALRVFGLSLHLHQRVRVPDEYITSLVP